VAANEAEGQAETIWQGQNPGILRFCHAGYRTCPDFRFVAGVCRRIERAAGRTIQHRVNFPAFGATHDGLLRLCLQTPRDPRFHPADRNALTQILAAGRASAAAERAAVQKAVIWFDRRMGPVIGTDKRVAKADIRALDDKHNYDCWDTTRNTTSLLLVLQQWGLFKYHVVGDPHYRGNALALQLPHNTAVLVERTTRVEWVVDMWPRSYLQSPDVMTVEKWVKED
jgi:hypothetical protein